jgi:hypothetical protein
VGDEALTGLLITLVYFGVIGAGVGRLLRLDAHGSRLDRLATRFVVGVGAAGATLFFLGVLAVPLTVITFGSLPVIAVISWIVRGRRTAKPVDLGRYPAIPTVIMLIPLVIVFIEAAIVPLNDWDGRAFWLLKGKAIAHEESIQGPFFQGLGARNLHSHYPLLMPMNAAVVFRFAGELDDRHVRWLHALTAAAFLIMLRSRIARLHSAAVGAWISALLAWLPQFSFDSYGGAVSAYSDLPLAVFAAAGLLQIVTDARPVPVGLWITFALLTKNEGMVIAAALLFCYFVQILRTAGFPVALSRVVLAGAPVVCSLSLLTIWRGRIPLEYDENYALLARDLLSKLTVVGEAAAAFLVRMVDLRGWGIFWPAVIAATAYLLWRRRNGVVLIAGIFLAIGIASYIAAYTVTGWKLADLAASSANRLLLQLIGAAALILAEAAQQLLGSREPEGESTVTVDAPV